MLLSFEDSIGTSSSFSSTSSGRIRFKNIARLMVIWEKVSRKSLVTGSAWPQRVRHLAGVHCHSQGGYGKPGLHDKVDGIQESLQSPTSLVGEKVAIKPFNQWLILHFRRARRGSYSNHVGTRVAPYL